ncbi:unnamed protein product [Peronospora belbahrii]|nr:unnamed protein product [Peronospora belbahrii]
MWNERAQEDCSSWMNQVLAIKGCRVTGHLVTWFLNGGNATQTKSLSSGGSGFGGGSLGTFAERAVINDIKSKQLGFGQKPDYITVKGTVNFIKHDTGIYYQACPKCQKKVVADVAQNYTCEKCQTSYSTCENRYILSVMMLDHTASTWTTCFNDQGKVVMNGRTADEIGELRDTNLALFESTFKEALFKQYVCRLRVKAENVQEELRVKAGVVSIEPVNFVQESKDLLQAIAQYN